MSNGIVTIEEALSVINADDLFFERDVRISFRVSAAEYERMFPSGSVERNEILLLLERNKMRLKQEIIGRLRKGELRPSDEQLYALIATSEERAALKDPKLLENLEREKMFKNALSQIDEDELPMQALADQL